ncbi:hypothetical protein AUJ66_08000 [Candidatus Desantisbacteria bacterium CG1_02_38_46]|uniref:D-erythrulose-1-phosphate dehydrogenase n=3 Tax=unclassified Candidatus Desantisiibacteriota TaxID=3106372 RepID=A0A2H9PB61_9BACT|nr:MAG: hypothetical protein AUJ66_08000 [Candidatus Desantisbacteria bacterium CG1_02_38_46]PIU51683.1 MAG: D-erythrulose-1-phosphate dehydrogenase [Candidatus Desantisbacteria bacterium CG07_land_8_20_14_0_80_39_15]PIZ14964.1 MAG: D-erythrulose-1-phosphate dehydrogenase [Candidatus Desantisbacteria bacterium CG_4_10_14_0_8_um_filter_39_17]
MTNIKLGINTGFATNRFPEPEVWTKIVGEFLGLRYVQFVADLLNPWLPWKILREEVKKIKFYCKKYDVKVDTTFFGAFTRVNHLFHPNYKIRKLWFEWIKKFFIISKELGARGSGTGSFGIFSVTDFYNKKQRKLILKEGIELWQKLSQFGKKIGFEFLIFEPMSIPRECACTIKDTKGLLKKVNEKAIIPVRLCLDVDHGDGQSRNPDDTNPYAWLKEFATVSPVIHIKQSTKDKGGHWPFISEYNKKGIIHPQKLIKVISESDAKDVVLTFEFSFRERYPAEYRVLDNLKESVACWRKYIKL